LPNASARLLQLVCQRFPLLSGRGTLIQQPPLKWLHFTEAQVPVTLRNGYKIIVFPNDFIGKSVLLFGEIDPKITRTLALFIDAGDTLVDVGANIGSVSIPCLEYVGPLGRIVAVEPQAECCAALRQSVALNGSANLEIHPIALSDRAGEFDILLPQADNLGRASFAPFGATGQGRVVRSTKVKVHHGGEFLESLKLRGEYIVKLDVEGHEGSVLSSFSSYFVRHPPKAVVFESTPDMYPGQRFQQTPAYQAVTAGGLTVFRILKSLWSMKVSEVGPEGSVEESSDFIACRVDMTARLQKWVVP
jgi:FkbM family methyltransferase